MALLDLFIGLPIDLRTKGRDSEKDLSKIFMKESILVFTPAKNF